MGKYTYLKEEQKVILKAEKRKKEISKRIR